MGVLYMRRGVTGLRRAVGLAVGGSLALLLSSCAGGHPTVDAKATRATSTTTTTVPATTTAPPTTTTTTTVPSTTSRVTARPTAPVTTTVTVPQAVDTTFPLPSLGSPPSGTGGWQPAGDRTARGYAIYTTTMLSPAAGIPATAVAWIDTAATRLVLFAGTTEPPGTWTDVGSVPADMQPGLLAAFNAGFQIANYRTGWYDQGVTAMPLQAGAASLVINTDGTATVGEWGRDVFPGSQVQAVRQNLALLVDGGAPVPSASVSSDWGAVLNGGEVTWRSGVGVTIAGDLVYVGGPGLTPLALARVLVAAGALRAMELDINPEWVSFATFAHSGGTVPGPLTQGTNLLPGMYFAPSHYLQPFSRDFFAVFAR